MSNPSEREQARDKPRELIDEWWSTVLAGQVGHAHPVQSEIHARVSNEELVLTGSVPLETDRDEIVAQARPMAADAGLSVRDEIHVTYEATDQPGLLVQTVIAVYASAADARLAEELVLDRLHGSPELTVSRLGPGQPDGLTSAVPLDYQDEARDAFAAGRSLLVATVDETAAFRLREMLDEETRSLTTFAAPPEVARNG